MNLEAIRKFLQGKKTYYLAILGALYLGGAWLGFYELDEKTLTAFGIGFVWTLRSALHLHFPMGQLFTTENTKSTKEDTDVNASGANVTLDPKLILLPFLLLVAFSAQGCAIQRVREFNPETKALTQYWGFSFFNRSALEGLAVGKRTPKSATVFSLEKGGTETQAEAIQALGQALGAGIAEGATAALKK